MAKPNEVTQIADVFKSGFKASQYRHSQFLTRYAEACLPDRSVYGSWQSVVTPIPVPSRSGEYHTWHSAEFMQDDAEPRAPCTIPKSKSLSMGKGTYKVEGFACAFEIANEDLIENDTPFNLQAAATDSLVRSYLIRRDRVFGDKFMNAAAAGSTEQCWKQAIVASPCNPTPGVCDIYNGLDPLTAFPKVDDCCDPFPFIEAHALQMQEQTGKRPNVMFMNRRVYSAILNNPAVQARLGNDKDVVVGSDLLMKLAPGIRIVVSDSIFAPKTAPGVPSVGQFTYGPHILLAHIAPRPSMLTATAIQAFQWSRFSEIFRTRTQSNPIMLLNRDDRAHCMELQMHGQIGLQCSSNILGRLFQNVID